MKAQYFKKIVTGAMFLFATPTVALELSPAELRAKSTDKAKVSILQDRYFEKSLRPEIGVLGGSFLNEAYTNTGTLGARLGLFFSEWIGAEVQVIDTSVSNSEDRRSLNKLKYKDIDNGDIVSPDPEVNKIHGVKDYNVVFAPFYGKLNLLDQYIVYSDLYFTSGYAAVDTTQGTLGAFTLGVGQRFYMLKSMSLRVDVRDRIYTELRDERKTRKNAYSFDFGISYFFL